MGWPSRRRSRCGARRSGVRAGRKVRWGSLCPRLMSPIMSRLMGRRCAAGAELAWAVPWWSGWNAGEVFDLPPLRVEVTEHRLISRACSCGVITEAPAPAGVTALVQYGSGLGGVGVYLFHGQFLSKSRTCQALADLFGAKIAASALVSWVQRIAARITSKVIPGIVDRIAGSAVAHFDETGLGAAGSLHWMHSASTATDVLLSVHARRGVRGMDAAGVLPRFTPNRGA
jgi:transposase